MSGSIQPGWARKAVARRSRGAADARNSGLTQASMKPGGAEAGIVVSAAAASRPRRARNAAITNTSTLIATPTRTVAFNPRAGKSTNAGPPGFRRPPRRYW